MPALRCEPISTLYVRDLICVRLRPGRPSRLAVGVWRKISGGRGGSAIDRRASQQARYRLSQKKEAHRRMFWLAEDDCALAQSAASRNVEGALDIRVHLRGLQSGAHAESPGQRSSSAVRSGP
jgi:hypothetical protein